MNNNVSSNRSIHIATSPRTGSTYLWWLFNIAFGGGQSGGANVFKTHILNESPENSISNLPRRYYWKMGKIFFKEEDYIVNVLRDPIDTIASMIIQEYFYLENKNDLEEYVVTNVDNRIEGYEFFHNAVPKLCNLILDYEEINIYKDNIVEHVSLETGNKVVNNNYVDFIKNDSHSQFLKSAKTFDQYQFVKELVSKANFDLSYKIYNNLLKNCKSFK